MTAASIALCVLAAGLTGAWALAVEGRQRLLRRVGWHPSSTDTRRRPVLRGRILLFAVGGAWAVVVSYVLIGPFGVVLAAVAAVAIPRTLRTRRARGAEALLESQLASAVTAIAAALRAGLSLSQSIRFAAAEASPPVADSIGAVVEREDLGVSLEESLDRWGQAASSPDVRLVADVLRLRIGAGLPRVLDQVCRSLRARETTRKDVRSLTAQARLSGTILGLLPVGFFLFLSVTSRRDMATAYRSPIGLAAITLGFLLEAGGYLWIRKLITVEV